MSLTGASPLASGLGSGAGSGMAFQSSSALSDDPGMESTITRKALRRKVFIALLLKCVGVQGRSSVHHLGGVKPGRACGESRASGLDTGLGLRTRAVAMPAGAIRHDK